MKNIQPFFINVALKTLCGL